MQEFLIKISLIGTFGAIGAISRFLINLTSTFFLGASFPVGTLIANVLGCLMFGLLASYTASAETLSDHWKIALMTGFLGALTTFSTFSYETYELFEFSSYDKVLLSLTNILANLGLGLLAIVLGIALGKMIAG